MVTEAVCASHKWVTVEEPYPRYKCSDCGLLPLTTIPGAQRDFVLSEARFPGLFAGRGYSKTTGQVIKTFKYAHEHPGAYMMLTQPTLGMVETNLIPCIRQHFGQDEGRFWTFKEKKMQLVITPENGDPVTIFLRPASEPDSCRGPTLAAAGMDEIGNEDQLETFLILQAALRQQGYPNQLWVTSTPNVRRRWIKQIWQDKIHPLTENSLQNPDEYRIFRGRTIDNPHLPEWQRTQLVQEWGDSRWGRQELEGEFIAVEGVGFPEFSREIHVRALPHDAEVIHKVSSIDFGAASPTACYDILQVNHPRYPRKLWVTREFYQRNSTDYDWVRWAEAGEVKRLVCDPSASEEQIRNWQATYGLHITRARSKRFDDRYRFWASRLALGQTGEPGIYIDPSCLNLIEEIENLTFHKPRGHEYAQDQWVPGSSDHGYDAVAYGGMEFDGYYGAPPKLKISYRGW